MKKSKSMIAGLISAFVCGLCVLTYMGIVQQEADSARNDVIARYGGEQVEVLVAKRDINPGEIIDGSNTLKNSGFLICCQKEVLPTLVTHMEKKLPRLLQLGKSF